MSSEMAESSQSLTDSQRSLLQDALRSGENSEQLTSSQRQAIREIRAALCNHATKPEQLLVGFKGLLNEVANDARLPLGGGRSAVIARFVTAFIEELYKPQRMTTTMLMANRTGRGPSHSLQQKLKVYPTLAFELPVRHFVYQSRELFIREVSARSFDSLGDVGADACSSCCFQLGDGEIHPRLFFCSQHRTPRKKIVRRRTIGAI